MAAYIPPGWPTGVHPPGSEDFEATAIAWLLDVVPPDFRLHGVLRRHPVALAVMARHHTQACVEGARAGYRTARTELGETLPPHAIDAVLAAYRTEGRRLASTAKAVVLIEEALRGDAFTPQLRNDHNTGSPRYATAGDAYRQSRPIFRLRKSLRSNSAAGPGGRPTNRRVTMKNHKSARLNRTRTGRELLTRHDTPPGGTCAKKLISV